jgi:hypothetical protein
MPTQKAEAVKTKPLKAKSLPKASNASQSKRASAGYARPARPPVSRGGR